MSAVASCTMRGVGGLRLVNLIECHLTVRELSIFVAVTQTFPQVKVLLVKGRRLGKEGGGGLHTKREIKLQFALLQY